jgi:hypothetical protein
MASKFYYQTVTLACLTIYATLFAGDSFIEWSVPREAEDVIRVFAVFYCGLYYVEVN